MLSYILGALFFAAAGYLGSLLGLEFSERIEPFADGPPPGRAPIPILIAACAAIGAVVTAHASPGQVLLIAIVCTALVAIWITDCTRGIVPDVFTLGPLGLILIVALWQHNWFVFLSAAVPFVPFAIAAIISHGRGMGWGDVKLVALGGALLGAEMSVFAFALACLAAALLNYLRGNRRGPIVFAPYLAAAIALSIPAGVLR
ncbi:MAG TPA: A24 family peptidase [Candidatus Rubrimentiphilum sp.]|nr:A24 family peptidase [Candidatus Rubrimentiphilum sp.]